MEISRTFMLEYIQTSPLFFLELAKQPEHAQPDSQDCTQPAIQCYQVKYTRLSGSLKSQSSPDFIERSTRWYVKIALLSLRPIRTRPGRQRCTTGSDFKVVGDVDWGWLARCAGTDCEISMHHTTVPAISLSLNCVKSYVSQPNFLQMLWNNS